MRIYRRYAILREIPALFAELARLSVPFELDRRRYGDVLSVTGEFRLYEDDPAFAEKRAAVERYDLSGHDGTEVSPEEEDRATWHSLSVREGGYPQPTDGWFASTYGKTDTCRRCGFHERQIAPLRFERAPGAKTAGFLGLHWIHEAVFVTDAVKALFAKERIRGVRYTRPLLHRSAAPITGVWQLDVDILSPALRVTDLCSERCEPITDEADLRALTAQGSGLVRGPYCGRVKYQHPRRGLLTLDGAALASAPEIVLTHEQLGSGGSSNRVMLVSKRVRDLVVAHRLRGAALRPVEAEAALGPRGS